jgi:ribosomal 50S subunit-associated protein YjgA (DUF615 family)
MGSTGHVECLEEKKELRTKFRSQIKKEIGHLEVLGSTFDDNIKFNLRKIEWGGMDCGCLTKKKG